MERQLSRFGLRISFGFRISVFGFAIGGLPKWIAITAGSVIVPGMRRLLAILISILLPALAGARADAAEPPPSPTGRILKVLPLFLDTNDLVATSPSLFDRDAYQFYLQEHTNDISGVRFDVQWKASHARDLNLKLRVEVRGIGRQGLPTEAVLEQTVTPAFFHHWTSLALRGPDYERLGTLAAWRATLWNGRQMLGEQNSFLWQSP